MRELEDYVGLVLDEKYRLEQLLGKGGMGAVYLATHLGTERYVALKLIAPQFMRNEEFVERFKREARAAGRLRHPNVVDVTDFGFANVAEGRVAYLVMEYLDGCTLGDVLAEEKSLSVEWTVDILEQVCSAVHEAHQQGIVHRDLKPDNIWLEPNRLGSYRVKVLDFGIAKLADTGAQAVEPAVQLTTSVVDADTPTLTRPFIDSADLEKATLLQPGPHDNAKREKSVAVDDVEEGSTKLFSPATQHRVASPNTIPHAEPRIEDDDGTLLFGDAPHMHSTNTVHGTTAQSGAALTRVGAIMGTPLYMSPEQCRGSVLDARTDIYSLGVIAYQMLTGDTPFAGKTSVVMKAHREEAPQPLHERSSKVPKRVATVVMKALEKDPANRQQTAFAFGSALRGTADGIGSLYRRAFALYSEYFPKFLKLSLIAHVPVYVATLLLAGATIANKLVVSPTKWEKVALVCSTVIFSLLQGLAYLVAATVISGVTAVIVIQLSAAPLRPVKLRSAFAVLKNRWRPFFSTMFRVLLRVVIGYILLIIPGIVISIRYSLYAPVVLIEGLEKKAAMQRARQVASRSWRTVIIVSILQFLIPAIVNSLITTLVGLRLPKHSLAKELFQQGMGLANTFVVPLMSIVPALLYLKMRQLEGESLSNAMSKIEETDKQHTQWQQRMRTRLTLHTPVE